VNGCFRYIVFQSEGIPGIRQNISSGSNQNILSGSNPSTPSGIIQNSLPGSICPYRKKANMTTPQNDSK